MDVKIWPKKKSMHRMLAFLLVVCLSFACENGRRILAAEKTAVDVPVFREAAHVLQSVPRYRLWEAAGVESEEEQKITNGVCGENGDNIIWQLADGVLTLNGNGRMAALPAWPWHDWRDEITTVYIGEGITDIGEAAFYECRNLSQISLPSTLLGIGKGAFAKCLALTDIELPQQLTDIGSFAFQDAGIRNIRLPSGLKTLGEYAASCCARLEQIEIPPYVKTIPTGAFWQCTSLSKVKFNKGLNRIKAYAFSVCDALQAVTLPAGIREIDPNAFSSHTKVKNLPDEFSQMEDGSICRAAKVKISVKEQYQEAFAVLKLVNRERKKRGLRVLKMDKSLLEASMLRAAEISLHFDHTRPSAISCFSVSLLMFGENIAGGYRNAEEVMRGWMHSPGHRANILTDSYQSVGIGCVEQSGIRYWVQCFGNQVMDRAKAGAYRDKSRNQTIRVSVRKPFYKPKITLSSGRIGKGGAITVSVRWDNMFLNAPLPVKNLRYQSLKKSVCTVAGGRIKGRAKGRAKVKIWFPGYQKGAVTKTIYVD